MAQTFVTPAAIPTAALPNDPSIFKQILVVDFGGSSVRAGIASSMPTLPQLFFPSVMAIGKGGHEDEKYFGMDAFAPEGRIENAFDIFRTLCTLSLEGNLEVFSEKFFPV